MPLLAAFNFDEASGDVLDRSGNGRDWSLNNGAARTASGHTLGGLTKNATQFCVIAPSAYGQTTARTFMFWMQGLGNSVWWLRWKNNAADTGTWGLYNLGGNINLRIRKGGSNTNITFPTPADGAWHHYAGTYDGTNSRLYVDGVLRATSGSVTAPLDTADLIDCLETSTTNQVMDDLRIYDEALSQAAIASLMSTPVTGSSGSTGTLAGTLPGPTAAIAGTAQASGVLAGTVPTPTAALVAEAVGSGLLVAQLPTPLAGLAGSALVAGALGGVLPVPVGALTGYVDVPEAVLSGVLPEPASAFAGTALALATVNGALPTPTGTLLGVGASAGVLDGTLPSPMATLTGIVQVMGGGHFDIMLPAMISITGRVKQMREKNQQRRATRDFIMASPTDIALIPNTETRTGSGATKMDEGVPRAIQTFRLIPMSHTERPERSLSDTGGGVQRKYDFTLLGEWDAVMAENDYFYGPDGEKYIVDALVPFNGYERKGLVMAYGRRARHG